MRPFPIEELVDRVGSRFTVVVAAAKRAKQLKDGAPPLVNLPTRNSLTIALHEIAAGLIQISDAPPEAEEAPEALAAAEPGDLAAPEVVEAALLAAGQPLSIAQLAALFGEHEPVQPVYSFDRAEVVLALDSDFLCCGPAGVRYARDFISRRRVYEKSEHMSRLYVVESHPSNTGAMADHRLRLRPQEIETVVRAVAHGLGIQPARPAEKVGDDLAPWVEAVVQDLRSHKGSSLIVVGESQPPDRKSVV